MRAGDAGHRVGAAQITAGGSVYSCVGGPGVLWLRSNVEGSILQASYPKDLFPAAAFASAGSFGVLNRQLISSHVKLIWSPASQVDLGVAFIYLQRKTEGGQRGNLERGAGNPHRCRNDAGMLRRSNAAGHIFWSLGELPAEVGLPAPRASRDARASDRKTLGPSCSRPQKT